MSQQQKNANIRNLPAPRVTLDRVCIYANAADRKAFRDQLGHRVRRAHFVRLGAYRRLLEIENLETGARELLYDLPRVPWVPKFKVVLVAGDAEGLGQSALLGVLELLEGSRVSLIELAFDFPE